jgi:TolA-binding protein
MNMLHGITLSSLLTLALLAPCLASAGSRDEHKLINRERIEELKARWAPRHLYQTMEAQLSDLQTKVTSLTAANTALQSQLQAAVTQVGLLQTRVTALETNSGGGSTSKLAFLQQYLTLDPNPINGLPGPHLIFTGANVHIRSGAGFTDHTQAANSGSFAGLGNLIVGYNEVPPSTATLVRTGAHNLVGGTGNSFSSFGGLVLGRQNTIGGKFATVMGGFQNEADGDSSSILGGRSVTTSAFAEHNP